jgi:periplasmic copper chaperone A
MTHPLSYRWAAVTRGVLGLALAIGIGSAAEAGPGSVTVEDAWARATPKGAKVAAGYLTIKNGGAEPDRLVSASAGFAGKTEMHQSSMADGMMKMRPAAGGVEIPPGSSVTLAPGSYHLMFMDLAAPLNEGDAVAGELVFERAGKVEVTFKVLGIGAQGPGEDAQPHQH